MSQLPEDSAKQMTVSRLEKARRFEATSNWQEAVIFLQSPSLYPKAAPNLEVLSGYREEVLRKPSPSGPRSRKRKINDKGRNSVLCLPSLSPAPGYTAGGCCKSNGSTSRQAPKNWKRETPLTRGAETPASMQ